MRKDLVDILVCPADHGTLTLAVASETGDEVISGSLTCAECGYVYPIEDKVPNLLPPPKAKSGTAGESN